MMKQKSKQPPRILVMAESANPEWVSVPLIGWANYRALKEILSVHLVTQIRNRQAILAQGLKEGKDFTVIDSERIARPLHRFVSLLRGKKGSGWTIGAAFSIISYYYFEWLFWKRFKSKLKQGDYDIVHRITPLSPTLPSTIAKKCKRLGIPFVVGPLNGGLPWPKQFRDVQHKEREWFSYVRNAYKLMPGYRGMRSAASAIIIGSQDSLNNEPRSYRKKCIYIPENGINIELFRNKRARHATPPLQLIFVGRLVPYKGVDMLIEAAAPLIKQNLASLVIIGDGMEKTNLVKQAKSLEIYADDPAVGGIFFTGWLDHYSIQNHLISSDLFISPSIREFGGGAVLEAMAVGLAPIVVDYGGPSELVTPNTGVLLPLNSRHKLVKSLRESLNNLVKNSSIIDQLGVNAHRRVQKYFTWPKKAHQIKEIYDWVLQYHESMPDFGMPFPD